MIPDCFSATGEVFAEVVYRVGLLRILEQIQQKDEFRTQGIKSKIQLEHKSRNGHFLRLSNWQVAWIENRVRASKAPDIEIVNDFLSLSVSRNK